MERFTEQELEIIKVAIKEFANNTSNFGGRFAEYELDKDEEVSFTNIIDKLSINLDEEL